MVKIVKPASIKNDYFRGIALHAIKKVKDKLLSLRGGFSPSVDLSRIDYDLSLVSGWTEKLEELGGTFEGKTVLELGVGADLGTGLILLASGAHRYIALDVNDWATRTPEAFYEVLDERLETSLRQEVVTCRQPGGRLEYVIDPEFQIDKLGPIDVVVSHSAFEHFDDPGDVIRQLAKIVKPGGYFVSRVDLQTHELGERDRDPLNIYRFGDQLWKWLSFKASPNRVRTVQYKQYLENDWDAEIEPARLLDEDYVEAVVPSLAPRFKEYGKEEMSVLGFFIKARRR